MSYGELKIDTITFTAGGVDSSISVSGLVQNPTFTGNLTTTGTISGDVIKGNTISGVNVIGTTEVSGATVTGDVGLFTTITGGIHTLTSGVFASGTAANPSITFVDDLDSGIYASAVNEVAISTSGTGRVFVNSSGNVGIGDTPNGKRLTINSADTTNGVLSSASVHLINSDAAAAGRTTSLLFGGRAASADPFAGIAGIMTSDVSFEQAGHLAFYTKLTAAAGAPTEQMRIDSAGRVLIGTNVTTAGHALIVEGGGEGVCLSRQTSSPADGDALSYLTFTSSNHTAAASIIARRDGGTWTNGSSQPTRIELSTTPDSSATVSTRLTIDRDGNVGIGTTDPSLLLHVSQGTADAGVLQLTSNWSSIAPLLTFERVGGAVAGQLRYNDGLTAMQLGTTTNHNIHFMTNANNALSINNSQQIGIGTTTIAAGNSLQVGVNGANIAIGGALSANGTGRLKFTTSNSVTNWQISNNDFIGGAFEITPSTTAGGATFSTPAVVIDSSGRLLVGATSAQGSTIEAKTATVTSGSSAYDQKAFIASIPYSTTNVTSTMLASYDGAIHATNIGYAYDGSRYYLAFGTSASAASGTTPTERMRITGTGLTKFSTTGDYTDIDTLAHGFRSEYVGEWLIDNVHAAASAPYGMVIYYSNAAPNGTSNEFLYCYDNSTLRTSIRSNGGIANYQSNDANLCDEREKKNIETLDSTWGCLKNWDLKKFHYNEDADTDDKRYGVIAQQIAPHCPEVITDWVKQKAEDAVLDDDGNVVTPAKEEILRMGVKEQQMMWMAIKALQEAQTRIETLEAEVAALKGA